MDACTVTWDGSHGGTWYVPCDQVGYITDDFINSGVSSITLYSSISQGGSVDRVIMPANQYPYYRAQNGYNNEYLDVVQNVRYNWVSNFYRDRPVVDIFVLMIVSLFCVIRTFKG